MTSRIPDKLYKTFLVTLVIAAVAAPVAAAGQPQSTRIEPSSVVRYSEPGSTGYLPAKTVAIPANLANFREPGSTGYLAAKTVTIPANLANFREPGSTGYLAPPTHVTIPARLASFREPGSTGWIPAGEGVATGSAWVIDWTSALIGGGVALGIALVCAGALTAVRKRRGFAHA